MQKPINKEIRHYEEDIFMGLSLRQLLCSVLALVVAVAIYFLLAPILDKETVSWLCIVMAAPIALAGFFSYDGLNFEQFIRAVVQTTVIRSGHRVWKSENAYWNAMQKKGQVRK